MVIADMLHFLQFFLIALLCIFATYHFVRAILFYKSNPVYAVGQYVSKFTLSYCEDLYVENYSIFHKYQIWRFYLFSDR